MQAQRAFVALGSSLPDAPHRVEAAPHALVEGGERLVAVADGVWSPYEIDEGVSIAGLPPVLDTVAEV
ncbi:MAG: hypothetical protein ACC662_10835, partial [Planctomycetota bacterium]